MTALLAALLLLAAASGLAVVLARDPRRQVFALAGNGLVLTLVFLVLQAPDVALSELAVGSAATPLLFLAALAAVRINGKRKPPA
ncbi:hydrogenase subunit MbhD domain-containing protein [Lichenibacterium dinghuense]|uniref:hydrogenase subunit MbhD domain-containing protein n=1 Tax=Lichenibacterium dinghuense TaxID=2895977 RepID=UPI001F430BCE|nr:hydrogenase subunit MbhD domain-containing protein [Lichenibacterium sp. 6Y81]